MIIEICIIQLRLGNAFYSNIKLKSHYLQFRIKRIIRNAYEQKHISQMSAILKCLCLSQTFNAQISSLILLEIILLGKCVSVGHLVTTALYKVI